MRFYEQQQPFSLILLFLDSDIEYVNWPGVLGLREQQYGKHVWVRDIGHNSLVKRRIMYEGISCMIGKIDTNMEILAMVLYSWAYEISILVPM